MPMRLDFFRQMKLPYNHYNIITWY